MLTINIWNIIYLKFHIFTYECDFQSLFFSIDYELKKTNKAYQNYQQIQVFQGSNLNSRFFKVFHVFKASKHPVENQSGAALNPRTYQHYRIEELNGFL